MIAKVQALIEKQALKIKTEEMQACIAVEERQSNKAAKQGELPLAAVRREERLEYSGGARTQETKPTDDGAKQKKTSKKP